jgi:hypothetical protein
MPEETIDYKKLYEQEQKKVSVLQQRLSSFELPGKTKLYYAVQRNMNDLADLLNGINLKDVNIEDPKDKTMERLKIIWPSIASLSTTLAILADSAGISGDEKKDLSKGTSFLDKNIS